MSRFISYAVNFEDVLLWRALGHIENGFYLDAGASHPVEGSVTKGFYDAGWHGINVEPSPVLHRALVQHRPRDVNLAVALGAETGGTTLARVCQEHVHADIHFLKVDVEGRQQEVLLGMDFTRWRPWVVVVGATTPGRPDATREAAEEPIARNGYRFVLFDGINRFYVAGEHPELLPAFVAPPNARDDFVPIALHEARLTAKSLEGELEGLRARVAVALEAAGATSARAENLALQVEALRQSRSWRYTAPCRIAGELVRTVAGKLAPILGLHGAWSSGLSPEGAFEELPASERRIAEDLRRCLPVTAEGGGAAWRERALELVGAPPRNSPAPGGSRPRLAYVSPLPPASSVVADHGAQLVPQLARFYDIVLIAEAGQGAGTPLAAEFPLREPSWFDRHAEEFDRVLYHFGNSSVHRHMLELLRRHPGTVVLHDFFLSQLVAGAASENGAGDALSRALYESHGYQGLLGHRGLGLDQVIRTYPLNRGVVDDAVGVIVHSESARQLAVDWYGPRGADDWRVVPMLFKTCARLQPSLESGGQAYFDAVEHLARHSSRGRCLELVREIARHAGPASGSLPELAEVARAVAAKLPPGSPRRLLVDVSAMARVDDRTGIQRVVRGVLGALLREPPAGCRVEPVASPGQGRAYRHACRFTLEMLGERELKLPEGPVGQRPGDLFLGLDFCQSCTAQNGLLLQSMHDRGVRIYFVVYDILPVLKPGAFPPGTEHSFGGYLRTVASVADGLICISRAVADEVHQWAVSNRLARVTTLQIGYFHLGVEFAQGPVGAGSGRDGDRLLAAVRSRPSFLMVGTVEPRKGHGQALDAFEQLWKAGHELNLVIAGKQGWMVQPLADRLRCHPRLGERLFWARDASDKLLVKLYGAATALLAASEGEGFGLPLIEAARHGLPVIARELPVFREVAGEHAHYFRGLTSSDLAASLERWLALRREGKAPDSGAIRPLTWRESARQLLDAIEHERWYKQVSPPGR